MLTSNKKSVRGTVYLHYSKAVSNFLNGHDPYYDLAQFGANLDKIFIRIRKRRNRNGNRITGYACLYGYTITFGVNDYEDMIDRIVLELNFEFMRAHETQVTRRRLYRERWEARHPGETFPWLEQHKKKDAQCKLFYLSA